jgi:MFS family permease
MDTIPALQRRTLRLLFAVQVAGSIGTAVGMSVGALLAAEMVSVGVSGLAQSAAVMGAALLAVPASRIVQRLGRRPSLSALYVTAAIGGVLVVLATTQQSVPLLFAGFFLFGGGTAASFQARFAAVDLAPSELVGRHLSLVVWASTLGGVLGPNLAPVAARTLGGYGLSTLAAPFALSVALFAVSATLLFTFMRPDPMQVARERGTGRAAGAAAAPRGGLGDALRVVRANADAMLGMTATAVGHVVMVGVMSMTPVHIMNGGHASADTIRIVGIVISIHIAGMYAFSPVMGWLSDRIGRRRVILVGVALLLAACGIAGTAGHDSTRLALGLFALGLGWSATMVAGSAQLSASIAAESRPAAQGLSDLVMGVAGASAGALSGVVVQSFGYPTLTLVAAVVTVPLAVVALARKQQA